MRKNMKTILCLLLVVLFAATALIGCAKTPETMSSETKAPATEALKTEAPKTEASDSEVPSETAGVQELGEGDKLFYFSVTFSGGGTTSYAIHTDAETVGEALVSLDLIAGEDSQYGLYVKTVGDETLDYDTDHMYWAFYENGEYAMTGVDSTAVTDGATYAFVATEG